MNFSVDSFVALATNLSGIIGIFAFLTSLITEVTKGISWLKKIPTQIQVLITSFVLCVASYCVYAVVSNAFSIGLLFLTFVGSFVVAFISIYGWEKIKVLYDRFKSPV